MARRPRDPHVSRRPDTGYPAQACFGGWRAVGWLAADWRAG
jgi:hypothetical protein